MGSVWHTEIDKALIKELSNIKINGSPIPVIIRNPTQQLDIKKPCISIYHSDEELDRFRYDWKQVVVNRDYDKNLITLEDSSIPFNITIQLDIWALKHSDLNNISMQFCKEFLARTYLPIYSDTGELHNCTLKFMGHTYLEELKETYKLLRKIYTFEIWVEVDRTRKEIKPMVTGIELKNNP